MRHPENSYSSRPSRGRWLTNFLLLLLVFFAGIKVRDLVRPKAPLVSQVPKLVEPRADLSDMEKSTIKVFEQAAPSVVFITSIGIAQHRFSFNLIKRPLGTGSGFVWDTAGHIVTNFHVVNGGREFEVSLSDRSTWNARLVGAEPDKDLAVLRVDAPPERLRPLAIGSSGDLQAGQTVLAIGNPFGLDQSLTTGIISGLGREIESMSGHPITGMIQTDAAINPGNSGGPLLDSSGRLIGINTAIQSPTGAYAGIGYAVPVDTVNELIPQLIEHGRSIKPQIGVVLLDEQYGRRWGIKGAIIQEVARGSGAEEAGLRGMTQRSLGDVIIGIDGKSVESNKDLFRILDARKPGDTVRLEIVRGNRRGEVEVTLQSSHQAE